MTDYYTEANRYGHTQLDWQTLEHPDRVQPRERAVPCQYGTVCPAKTWNVRGLCDHHYFTFDSATSAPAYRRAPVFLPADEHLGRVVDAAP